ncbi:MAG: hypothetical protein JST01_19320 [Cyanobacteria bacterium SZAS TMP-1]|nr:hypothetical protein [Cyanobacteria bacterium SZAS TMP-1]
MSEIPQRTLSEIVHAHMNLFDPNRDGNITMDELRRAAARQGLDGETHQTIVALTRTYSEMSKLTNDQELTFLPKLTLQFPITKEPHLSTQDLDRYSDISKKPMPLGYENLIAEVNFAIEQTRVQENVPRHLFNARGEITPAAVQQGNLGDCSFMASLASLASTAHGREELRKMIQTRGDKFVVTFPDGQCATVSKPTTAELELYAGNNGNGTWPAVMEKAYATLLARKRGDVLAPQPSADHCEGYDPLGTLTAGHKRVVLNPSITTNRELHAAFTAHADSVVAMTAGTGENPLKMSAAKTPALAEVVDERGNAIRGRQPVAISGYHVYAIDHYDAARHLVYMRNPASGGELIRVKLDTFRQAFCGLNIVHH